MKFWLFFYFIPPHLPRVRKLPRDKSKNFFLAGIAEHTHTMEVVKLAPASREMIGEADVTRLPLGGSSVDARVNRGQIDNQRLNHPGLPDKDHHNNNNSVSGRPFHIICQFTCSGYELPEGTWEPSALISNR